MSIVGQVPPAQLVQTRECVSGVGGEGVVHSLVIMPVSLLTSSAKRITMLGLSEAVLAVAPEVYIWKQQIAIAARLALEIIATNVAHSGCCENENFCWNPRMRT